MSQDHDREQSRQRRQARKGELAQRRAEQARIKAENEPIRLKPGEPFQQQMSERAAVTTPLSSMAHKGGKEFAQYAAEQSRQQKFQSAIRDRMQQIRRPPADDDREHKHGHSL